MAHLAPGACSVAFLLCLSIAPTAVAQECQPHFVYARVGSATSTYLYYVYDIGEAVGPASLLLSAAIILDPHADESYWEQLIGPGFGIQRASAGVTFLGHVSHASDAWYLEPSLYAWGVIGRLEGLAFGGLYAPLEEAGIRQYFLDPASLLLHVPNGVAVGASYSLFGGDGLPTEQGAGPALRIGDPSGISLTMEHFREIENFGPDWRVTLQALF